MASTGDRRRDQINENLEVDGQPIDLPQDLNTSLLDAGVSSVDLVAFAKVVSQDFNVKFAPEDCARHNTLQGLIEFIDSHTG